MKIGPQHAKQFVDAKKMNTLRGIRMNRITILILKQSIWLKLTLALPNNSK
jgi:hypothetical protein